MEHLALLRQRQADGGADLPRTDDSNVDGHGFT
jgi:hypothetical protein